MTVQNDQDTSDAPGEQSPESAVCNEVAAGESGFVVQAGIINGGIHHPRRPDQVPVPQQLASAPGRPARRSRVLLVVLLVVLLPVISVGGTIMVVTRLPYRFSSSDQGQSSTSSSGAPSAAPSPSSAVPSPSGSSPAGSRVLPPGPGSTPAAVPLSTAKSPPATLIPGSEAHLQNAATNQCMSDAGSGYPGFGTCSASYTYDWTLRPLNGGTFELVNRTSGSCLSVPFGKDFPAVLSRCGDGYGMTGSMHWRIGRTTAAGQTLENTETGHCLAIASSPYGGGNQVMVTTCNSDQPQQLWRNGRMAADEVPVAGSELAGR